MKQSRQASGFWATAASSTLLLVLFLATPGCEPWWESDDDDEEPAEEVVEGNQPAPPAAAPAPCVLDQSQLAFFGGAGTLILPAQTIIQTFTAGVSGDLCKVKIDVSDMGAAADITVTITTTVAGDPTAGGVASLGAVNLPAASVQPWGTLETFNFAPGVTLTGGTVYAIVVSTADVAGGFFWRADTTAPYAAGAVWVVPLGGGPYAGDYVFETYMQ